MPSQHNTGTHPFFMTSQHNTGIHPFYIGMYIHNMYTYLCAYIYFSEGMFMYFFTWTRGLGDIEQVMRT